MRYRTAQKIKRALVTYGVKMHDDDDAERDIAEARDVLVRALKLGQGGTGLRRILQPEDVRQLAKASR